MRASTPGQIIILNGAPRSGKSTIAKVIQDTFYGVWMNLGVDAFNSRITPGKYLPGIGLRPGETEHPVAALQPVLFAALYESIAALSRLGLNVVSDVGHHDGNVPGILVDCARRLEGLPVLIVGVRCPLEIIMERRNATWGPVEQDAGSDDPIPAAVRRWQNAVHDPGIYDLEVDTSLLDPGECAEAIRRRLYDGPPPSAFTKLARGGPPAA